MSFSSRGAAAFVLRTAPVAALLAIGGLALATGCRSGDAKTPQSLLLESNARVTDRVRSVVDDPERADAAIDALERFREREEAFIEEAAELRAHIGEMNRDYGASREDLLAEVEALTARRRSFGDDMVAVYGELEEILEPDEWQSVAAAMLEEESQWKALID